MNRRAAIAGRPAATPEPNPSKGHIPMSIATLTHPHCEIREGLSSFGDGREHPYFEGVVAGQGVAIAFETPPDDDGMSVWLLAAYSSTAKEPGRVHDPDAARKWLEHTTLEIAKVTAHQPVSGGRR